MVLNEILLSIIFISPFVFAVLCFKTIRNIKYKFAALLVCIMIEFILGLIFIIETAVYGPSFYFSKWFFLDSLSAFNLLVLLLVFCLASIYSISYFNVELKAGIINKKGLGKFLGLWLSSFPVMLVVLFSNNIALIWIGMEATTLITAFLICLHKKSSSVEAMWKYIIICSVGVAFAFIGIILLVASFKVSKVLTVNLLLWTEITTTIDVFNIDFVKISFIFILIGFGTKAGLAPMHTWLPDAHSQAPAPVSAIFSGFILSESIYCISRFIPIVEKATNYSGWCLNLILFIGLFSLIIATFFIPFQKNLKRLFAYSSIENIGIIAVALGLGGFGTFAALFHTLNHSLSKTLGFFSAGKIDQEYGSNEIARINNLLKRIPDWGTGLLFSMFILMGIAPFAIFMSKLQIIMTFISKKLWILLCIFLSAVCVIFIAMVKKILNILWKNDDQSAVYKNKAAFFPIIIIFLIAGSLLLLSFGLPWPLDILITQACQIINGGK